MDPAEEVQSSPWNTVRDTLDGVPEVLSGGDERHADQEEGHTDSVVESEHEIINPGGVMFGDDGLQRPYDPVHVDVDVGALPR